MGLKNKWLRESDLNGRPSAYEADELPDCSTAQPVFYADAAWLSTRYFSTPVNLNPVAASVAADAPVGV